MINSRITSFTMAVILVLWSPGWCCCGVSGEEMSSSACAGRTAPRSQQESTAANEVRGNTLATRSTESCTRVADLVSQSRCCDPSSGGPTSPEDDPSSCGCATHAREANLAWAAMLPKSIQTDLLVVDAMAWTLVLDVPGVENYGLRLRPARAGPGLPCADSLLRRHCLLTV